MARLLIALDLPDAGDYASGMVLTAMPDDHRWGRLERAPRFARLSLPGTPVERVARYLEPWEAPALTGVGTDTIRVRRWRLEVERLPEPLRAALYDTGLVVGQHVAWDELRTYLRDLATGLTETEAL